MESETKKPEVLGHPIAPFSESIDFRSLVTVYAFSTQLEM